MPKKSSGMKKLKENIKNDKKDFLKFLLLFVAIIIMVGITIWLLPWIISLKDEAGRAAFQEYIHSKGVAGVFILLGVQIMQVIVAFIPGEPIEVIAGLLYGVWGGYFICTIGMIIGTVVIFYGVKFLGASFISRFIDSKKLEKYRFLNDAKRLEGLTFLLFFIPGTPKDLLTYFMPLTKIKPMVFFVIVTIARIPSVISSTFAGQSIGDGKWVQTLVIFGVIGLVGIIGIVCNDLFMKKAGEKKEKIKKRIQDRKQK